MKHISKSKFLAGLQCHKLLWSHFNARDRFPTIDTATQASFDQGHQVGELARRLYPDGIMIGHGLIRGFGQIFEKTRDGLTSRLPLFEPAFSHSNGYARAGILVPVGKNAWDIVEVKSTTEVKDIHIDDIAFQRFVFVGAGVRIRNCFVLHINNQYVRNGDIDPKQLFTKVGVTDLVAQRLPHIESELRDMIKVVEQELEPEVGIGVHCDDPYTCPLHDYCWADVPEHSVLSLYRLGKKAWDLYDSGVEEIASIPSSYRLTANQQIQRDAVVTGVERIDKNRISQFLQSLVYPLYFLDFESINPAVPAYEGTRPYQQIAFQFSLHVQESPTGELVCVFR